MDVTIHTYTEINSAVSMAPVWSANECLYFRKFDFAVYAIILSKDPLRVYMESGEWLMRCVNSSVKCQIHYIIRLLDPN